MILQIFINITAKDVEFDGKSTRKKKIIKCNCNTFKKIRNIQSFKVENLDVPSGKANGGPADVRVPLREPAAELRDFDRPVHHVPH